MLVVCECIDLANDYNVLQTLLKHYARLATGFFQQLRACICLYFFRLPSLMELSNCAVNGLHPYNICLYFLCWIAMRTYSAVQVYPHI